MCLRRRKIFPLLRVVSTLDGRVWRWKMVTTIVDLGGKFTRHLTVGGSLCTPGGCSRRIVLFVQATSILSVLLVRLERSF